MHTRLSAALLGCALLAALPAMAQDAIPTVTPRDGWAVHDSAKTYQELVDAVKAAADTEGLGVVTEAGPTQAAAERGVQYRATASSACSTTITPCAS